MKNLIISNNDILWSKEYDNILLGDWCFLGHEKKKSFDEFKYEIFDYHWSNLDKLSRDINYLQNNIWDEALDFLSSELNNYHGVSLSKSYWESVVKGWLIIFIPMVFDRYETLRLITNKNSHSKLKTKIFEFDDSKFISNETFEFATDISLTNEWTHWLNSKIIKYLDIDFELVSKLDSNNHLRTSNSKENLIKINTKKRLNLLQNQKKNTYKKIFQKIGLYKVFKRKLSIIDCHLSKFDKVILYLMFGQVPESYNTSFYEYSEKKDLNFRKKNSNSNFKEKNFFNFLKQNIFLNIPKSFLEDYKSLINHQKSLDWPQKPRIILSSIGGHYNDIFNIYVAEKKLLGAKLIYAQHGGVYGVSKYCLGEFIENKADRFLTWGWKRNKKNYPLFFLGKDLKKTKKNVNANGIIMSATNFFNIPYQPRAVPKDSTDTRKHVDTINNFLTHLDKKLLSKFDINYADFNRAPNLRDEIRHKEVKFLNLKEAVIKRSVNYKLVVETINSTGFIENLYYNVPFIALFNKAYCPLDDEAKKYYENLESLKIIFYNPLDAAKHVNKIYDDVYSWWNSANLQKGRKIFCEKYAKRPKNFFKSWKKAFEF